MRLRDDFHVLAQGDEEAHEAFDGELPEVAARSASRMTTRSAALARLKYKQFTR